jgi:hypothetical protein
LPPHRSIHVKTALPFRILSNRSARDGDPRRPSPSTSGEWIELDLTETACAAPATRAALYRNATFAFSINDSRISSATSGLDGILYSRCGETVVLHPPAGWHESYGWAVSGDGSAAAGYSFPSSGAVQAAR